MIDSSCFFSHIHFSGHFICCCGRLVLVKIMCLRILCKLFRSYPTFLLMSLSLGMPDNLFFVVPFFRCVLNRISDLLYHDLFVTKLYNRGETLKEANLWSMEFFIYWMFHCFLSVVNGIDAGWCRTGYVKQYIIRKYNTNCISRNCCICEQNA